MAYAIWCEGFNDNAGYYCYTTEEGYVAYTENIYNAKKFPSYESARHLSESLEYNPKIRYTEIIEYNH